MRPQPTGLRKGEPTTLSHTRIEYALNPDGQRPGYLWPVLSGCLHGPDICATSATCWARDMNARRLPGWKAHYNPDFSPRFNADLIGAPLHVRKPATFLVAFTGELFGDWLQDPRAQAAMVGWPEAAWHHKSHLFALREEILATVSALPQHRFIFLTKRPENLATWNPWPRNAWVGMSLTGRESRERQDAMWKALERVQGAGVRWLSLEPALGTLAQPIPSWVDWVVIGRQTGKGATPFDMAYLVKPLVWTEGHKPLWEKNNLFRGRPLFLCQELPHA